MYFQERFPLPGVLFISVSFALLALSLAEISNLSTWATTLAALVVLFTALLLRQRVTDEFKDMQHDAQHYPDRPYQRGLVGKRTLLGLLAVALALELSMAFYLSGIEYFWWYLPVFAYSLLMAKEFFVAKWLEARFTLYFLTHELLFVLIALWIVMALNLPNNVLTFSWAIAFIVIMVSIEIARKFERRRDKKGREVKDTYTSVWGENTTRSSIELLVLTSGVALSYAEQSLVFGLLAACVALTLNFMRPKTSILQLILGSYILTVGILGVLL